ncbi:MAG: 4Fe-4S binding protein [Treponema sp.]|jgi:Fe-S-cluster-containing hydrogenase component 2|nr:4Fe-4S binding protein [Treponema sp.]
MIKKIIKIDEDKCSGCGLCVNACHEGAIAMVDNKARLVRDVYCDGLGNCLPVCPAGAISLEERVFSENASKGLMSRAIKYEKYEAEQEELSQSELRQWPVQIKLVPVSASFFNEADLLVAADCCAYACGDFHRQYMKNKITIIGCPKLDNIDYTAKLTEIISGNNIKSVIAARMEVPCCSGIVNAVSTAVESSGKDIPADIVVLNTMQ